MMSCLWGSSGASRSILATRVNPWAIIGSLNCLDSPHTNPSAQLLSASKGRRHKGWFTVRAKQKRIRRGYQSFFITNSLDLDNYNVADFERIE